MTLRTGGCLCGAVRIEVDADPLVVRTCWCRLCQALGAGSATVNAAFPADKVTTTGEVRWHDSVADSGNRMRRGFCPACGTPLFSAAESRPHLAVIRVGAFDERDDLAPQMTIWTDAAPAWACISETIPAHSAQVPPVD
ncbi:GFA family protein [Sphingomonas jatrophae]|uniref:Uncharacterized conserved protein n=1 Tax=Sphingomonas jatrophae TaxID=1166337 RepID=A0A1I6JMD4_9SPHN|nr:GFA family protein [Sphingomonas jatrophae]SFR80114.1 Uncharacterized conserved protein [Sphingomonas jatrophae]